jgi:hypothetical protein
LQLVGDRDAARLGGMLELPVTSTSGMQFPSIILQHVSLMNSNYRATAQYMRMLATSFS